jgi:hypothetical protein
VVQTEAMNEDAAPAGGLWPVRPEAVMYLRGAEDSRAETLYSSTFKCSAMPAYVGVHHCSR